MARSRRGRGEGSVTEDKARNRWVAVLSLGFDGTGKWRRKKVYGRTKQDVLKKLDALRARADSGQIADAKGMTVGQLFIRWLAASKANIETSTWEERERVVTAHLIGRVGKLKLEKFTTLHVE